MKELVLIIQPVLNILYQISLELTVTEGLSVLLVLRYTIDYTTYYLSPLLANSLYNPIFMNPYQVPMFYL